MCFYSTISINLTSQKVNFREREVIFMPQTSGSMIFSPLSFKETPDFSANAFGDLFSFNMH